jgi:uncharacterized membrane protein
MSATTRRRINDRALYISMAIVVPLVVLAGFARTYYLKDLFNGPALPSRLVHLHGLVMSAWVVLFVMQVTLVATRRTRTHQRLGIAGGVLGVVVVIVGVCTAIYAAARGSTPGPPALQFMIVPLVDMLIFSILFGAALYYRRRLDVHKRLMLLTALNLLTPAIARIPLSLMQTGGPLAFFGFTDLIIFVAIVVDTLKHRRLHPAFLWGTILIVASQPLRLWFSSTHYWEAIASTLVGLVT